LPRRLVQKSDVFRQEENFWDDLVSQKFAKSVRKHRQNIKVDLRDLLGYHKALARRILRRVLPGSTFQDIERVLTFAQSNGGAGPMRLAQRIAVERRAGKLIIHT
ncbi:MAG TPA: hypothetical protein VMU17_07020, partial [Elusimicrobiota bacterium]|nr:hypothetical protein [Elusimicrobiota bacterium]